jgi:hypothetical protein
MEGWFQFDLRGLNHKGTKALNILCLSVLVVKFG